MKRLFSFPMILCMIGFMSCSKEQTYEVQQTIPLTIQASIKGMTTRVSKNSWSKNDSIGVFSKKAGHELKTDHGINNLKYVTTKGDGIFTPANTEMSTYLPIEKQEVDLIAYYPYKPGVEDYYVYPIDVSTQDDQASIDLLYSDNVTNIKSLDNQVGMTFTHQLSKVVLDIKSSDSTFSLEGLQAVMRNTGIKSSFKLDQGTLNAPSRIGDICFNVTPDGQKAEAIVLPTAEFTNEDILLTVGDESFNFFLNDCSTVNSFEKATIYTFSLTINPLDSSMFLEEAATSITEWSDGPSEALVLDYNFDEVGYTPIVIPKATSTPQGEGTLESPYNVAAAKLNYEESKRIYLTGYVVGSVYSGRVSCNGDEVVHSNAGFLLADNPYVTELSNCIALEPGDKIYKPSENPQYFLKKIIVEVSFYKVYLLKGVRNIRYFEVCDD